VGIPLFFSEQRARIKAGKYAMEAAINLQAYYIRKYDNSVTELVNRLEKHGASIRYYEKTGKQLADELYRVAQRSYDTGEIDFFRFVQSLDNAIEIELDYLDNLFKYNELVLDINFLTL
jgi:cobalt-zinc-cadmium resistance protein CzcA